MPIARFVSVGFLFQQSAAGVNYTYDGDGNRIEKSSGKIYWYGAGTEILDESDTSGNFSNEYVFFGGKRVAMRVVSSGNIYYYEDDMLGSARIKWGLPGRRRVEPGGSVQAGATSLCGVYPERSRRNADFYADFYPFGGERDITTTCGSNYKFEGKERDTETGNDDFGARYYASRLGRWLSAGERAPRSPLRGAWEISCAVPAPVPYANLTNLRFQESGGLHRSPDTGPQTLNLCAVVSRRSPPTSRMPVDLASR